MHAFHSKTLPNGSNCKRKCQPRAHIHIRRHRKSVGIVQIAVLESCVVLAVGLNCVTQFK